MTKGKVISIIVCVILVLLVGSSLLYGGLRDKYAPDQLATQPADGQEGETEAPKVEAPDFTVYDRDGNAVTLSQFRGMPVVLNFWASWCGPCRMEMPDFDKAAKELEGKVQFLMVNMTDGSRETVETASRFIDDQGFTFPVFFDTDVDAAFQYNASALPTTYFIDAEGYAIAQAKGAITADILEQGISMILPQE